MSDDKKDFVVKDRRLFSGDSPSDEATTEAEAAVDESEEESSVGAEKSAPSTEEEDYALPEINFATFVFSLNSSALVHLGVIEDPATNQMARNLPMAKQTIDILGMLEEKTRGNLLEDEATLLKNVLYELRMLYVKERR